MKKIKYFFLAALSVAAIGINAQSLKTFYSTDEPIYKGDTIILEVTDFYGDIQWQKTRDLATWADIEGATSGTLEFVCDSSAYFRAAVTGGFCESVFSDTILINVLEKNVKTFTGTDQDIIFEMDSASSPELVVHDLSLADSLNAGDILVSLQGEGLIRKVENIETRGDSAVITTSEVSLEEVIDLGQLTYEQFLSFDSIESMELAEGVQLVAPTQKAAEFGIEFSFSHILFDEDNDEETTGDQVLVKGSLAMKSAIRLD